jgi:hypothetical protein
MGAGEVCTDRLTRLLLFFFFFFEFSVLFFCTLFVFTGAGEVVGQTCLLLLLFFFFLIEFSVLVFCTLLFFRFAFTGGWGSGGSKLYQNDAD